MPNLEIWYSPGMHGKNHLTGLRREIAAELIKDYPSMVTDILNGIDSEFRLDPAAHTLCDIRLYDRDAHNTAALKLKAGVPPKFWNRREDIRVHLFLRLNDWLAGRNLDVAAIDDVELELFKDHSCGAIWKPGATSLDSDAVWGGPDDQMQ